MPENGLTIYQRMDDPLAAVKALGRSIAMSHMFGAKTIDQGEVMALECLATGIPPLTLARRFHVINNQLSEKADSMLAQFIAAGGKAELLERSPERASVRLTSGERSIEFSFSWEDARQEPFVYEVEKGGQDTVLKMLASGKQPPVKAKYATPRSRMQMLWARCVSDGIRAMTGGNFGLYTPEELGGNDDPSELPGEFTVSTVTTAPTGEKTVVEYCTAEQSKRIRDLFSELLISFEDQQAVLDRRGVTAVRSLTTSQAAEIIANLEKRLPATAPADPPVQDQQSISVDGPCTALQVEQCKALIKEIEQTDLEIVAKIQAKLHPAGYKKIAELTYANCEELRQALAMKNLSLFIDSTLTPKN